MKDPQTTPLHTHLSREVTHTYTHIYTQTHTHTEPALTEKRWNTHTHTKTHTHTHSHTEKNHVVPAWRPQGIVWKQSLSPEVILKKSPALLRRGGEESLIQKIYTLSLCQFNIFWNVGCSSGPVANDKARNVQVIDWFYF